MMTFLMRPPVSPRLRRFELRAFRRTGQKRSLGPCAASFADTRIGSWRDLCGNTASETGSSHHASARAGDRRHDERNHHSARNGTVVFPDEALSRDAQSARWPSGLPPVDAGLGWSAAERESFSYLMCSCRNRRQLAVMLLGNRRSCLILLCQGL